MLSLVLIVWGILGFKVVNTISPSVEEKPTWTASEKFFPKPATERDTFSILADYRDPFLGTIPKRKASKKPKIVKSKKKEIPERQISYSGFITESTSGNKIFFVSIDNQQYMMSISDTRNEVKLTAGNKEMVKVRYGGVTKTILLTE
ncbi:hypothetical protein [Zobellia sp. OII3]|uniref:hypothetical protein n=1 Tax=Zobellia sp. OII3 TaxID=2034520 RepID=UPI000F508E88|nr:hypothetical protein [Zobellia sp. OII3]